MRRLRLIPFLVVFLLAVGCGSSPAPVSLTAPTAPDGYVGDAYALALQVAGGEAPYQFTVQSGALPAGLSLDAGTGQISGTPTAPGSASLVVGVTDESGTVQTARVELQIWAALALEPGSLPPATVGTPYDQVVHASGGKGPLSVALSSGSPGAGLSFANERLSGTPTQTGTQAFQLTVTDANGHALAQDFSLSVQGSLTITSGAPLDGYVGKAFSHAFTAEGVAPLAWQVISGALPAGLSLSADGTLQGTPTTEGLSGFTVQVQDGDGLTATQTVTLDVYRLPTLDTLTLPDGTNGVSYSQSLGPSGGKAPLTVSKVTGTLQTGLSLTATGIAGTPTESATRSLTFRVTDANNRSFSRSYTLTVSGYSPPQITTPSLPNANSGYAYAAQIEATGGSGTLTFSLASGSLPAGLSLAADGTISGTPSATGSFPFEVKVVDGDGGSDQQAFTLTVADFAPVVMKVGSWNVEWFGDATNGPSDEGLQQQNVQQAIESADLDLWGLAELVDQTAFDTLVASLPGYAGFMANDSGIVSNAGTYYSSGEQKVGILYKSDRFTVTAAKLITACNYDFAGRPPLEVSLTFDKDGATQAFKLIVLHAKAFADQAAYEERRDGGACLKSYLDGYPTDHILVVGDWNDDVDQSITYWDSSFCTEAGSSGHCESPYLPFVADSADYTFLTAPLSASGEHSTTDFPEMIDHHMGTNEMDALHVGGSTQVLHPAITNYGSTTSDHYPVESDFSLGGAAPPSTPSTVIINEVRFTELEDGGGNPDYDTEFVELVNTGASAVDLTGWTLSDSSSVRHTFSGTVLAAGKAVVVFGGAAGIPGGLGNAMAASSGTLSLHPDDSVSLRDDSGDFIGGVTWDASDLTTPGLSANRATDGDGEAGFVAHDQVQVGVLASPGTRADGTDF